LGINPDTGERLSGVAGLDPHAEKGIAASPRGNGVTRGGGAMKKGLLHTLSFFDGAPPDGALGWSLVLAQRARLTKSASGRAHNGSNQPLLFV